MNNKIFIGIGVVAIIGLMLVLIFSSDFQSTDNNNTDSDTVAEFLEQFPQERQIHGRTVVFERGTTPPEPKEEFAEAELFDVPEKGNPLEFIELGIVNVLGQEHVQNQSDFFTFTVSFHSLEDNKVTAVMNLSDIPDDSVGATEERIDFVITEGEWNVEWYGQRVFCRRMDAEFWQPADLLCP